MQKYYSIFSLQLILSNLLILLCYGYGLQPTIPTTLQHHDDYGNQFKEQVLNNRNRHRTDNMNEIGDHNKISPKRTSSNGVGVKTPYNVKSNFMEIIFSKRPTYLIVASRMVRPGLTYQVAVSILQLLKTYPIIVHASISCDGVEISGVFKEVKEGIPETLLMRVPPTSISGEYKLRVEGIYQNVFGDIAFLNETSLQFSQRSMTIFIQTDKPIYKQGETVRFRAIPITTELKGFDSAIDVYMIDPNGHMLRRWLSKQSNLGTVSLEYKLSDQLIFGKWTIRVVAQGQIEEGHFEVEEYYQTRFEVNVTMPAYFFTTDSYIYGKVMANFTSGQPVMGNLTIKATLRPIGYIDKKALNEKFRLGRSPSTMNDLYNKRNRYQYNVDRSQGLHNNPDVIKRSYQFDEEWPFWISKPEGHQIYDPLTESYKNTLPHLRYFNGTFDFKYSISSKFSWNGGCHYGNGW